MAQANRWLLGTALVLPWLFIWQGLDVTDQGYLLTIFRCFLRHPEAVAHTSHMWLTNVVGAVWDLLFGWLGVVSQRALWALCTSIGMFIAFRAVRVCTSERAAALGVLVTSSFLANRRESWFSYNTATSLISAAAAVTLFHAIRKRSLRGLVLAGFFLGCSPFARLSNVLHGAMLAALIFAALIDRQRLATLPRDLGAALLGYAGAVALAFVGMFALGHWSYFWTAAYDLLHPSAPSVNHSTSGILQRLLREHLLAVPAGLGIFALGFAVVKVAPRLPKVAALGLYLLLAALASFGLTRGQGSTFEPWTWFMIGPAYIFLAAIALGLFARNFEQRVACFIGLVALFITPVGSDMGLRAGYQGMFFAFPLAVGVLYSVGSESREPVRALAIVAIAAFLVESVSRDLIYSYRDLPHPQLWTPVRHPQLKGQLTHPARAKAMEEVLAALEARVARGDYLLAYDGTPLLQYLTFTRPYIGRPWLMTDDDPAIVPGLLRTALKRSKCLPVAVRSLRSARGSNWPVGGGRLERKHAGTRKAVGKFLKRHEYRSTWTNGFFEILEPAAAAGACR